jgi:maltose O-acetyltransferase
MRGAEPLGRLIQTTRILTYRVLSTCPRVSGTPIVLQPVRFVGLGRIVIGERVEFGWQDSAGFYSGYSHVEASTPAAVVEFGDDAQINNGAFIKSEGPGIRIGPRALLGSDVVIFDSDFHDLRAGRRRDGRPRMAPVQLEEDVFIGEGAKILKGVTIGAHSVIGAGSVVTRSVPAGVIAAGNPARVLGELPGEATQAKRVGVR